MKSTRDDWSMMKTQISIWLAIILLIIIGSVYCIIELMKEKPQCDLWWCYTVNNVSKFYTDDCNQCVRYDVPIGEVIEDESR